MPKAFDIDDSMFVFAPENTSDVEVVRGPSIGTVPVNDPLPDALTGPAAIKVGDLVTTDHIMPAGARLKHRSNVQNYSKYVFEPVDEAFPARAAEARNAGEHNFIVAGESYGQGSSREHAALCPMFLGVKAVIARSIERIHCANLINFGIVPFTFRDAAGYEAIAQGDRLEVPGIRKAVEQGTGVVLKNLTRGTDVPLALSLSDRQKAIILSGGLLNYVRERAGS